MNARTHDFDAAVQIRQSSVERILRAQHAAGVMRHLHVQTHGTKAVEILINRPSLALSTPPSADGIARAHLSARVFYHSRDLYQAADVGVSAVADDTIRNTVALSTGDPAILDHNTTLDIDWGETGENDIQVPGASPALRQEVKTVLTRFIREYNGGKFSLPAIGTSNRRVRSMAFRFLDGPSQNRTVVVGLNFGPVVKGAKEGLAQLFVRDDWAVAISSEYLRTGMLDSLRNALPGGQLPPPNGPGPVLVSTERVCTLPSPFGCLDRATRQVFIQRLEVKFEPGRIFVEGRLRVTHSVFYVPDITVAFGVPVTLFIGPGGNIAVQSGAMEVDAQGFFSDVTNFLSGGILEDAVRQTLERTLQPQLQSGATTGFFSGDLLGRLASLSISGAIQINEQATAVGIDASGLVIHGNLNILNGNGQPRAAFNVRRPRQDLTRRLFQASASWAPGEILTAYRWDFDNGTVQTFSGNNIKLIVEQNFQPGEYNVCLTVSDSAGRQRTTCSKVSTARLMLRHTRVAVDGGTLPSWRACLTTDPIPVEIFVFDSGTPVPDALVTVEGRQGYQLQDVTDAGGRVTFTVDLTGNHARTDTGGRGFMIVRAEKNGYLPANFQRLIFVDCNAWFGTVDLGRGGLAGLTGRYRDILDRVAQYGPIETIDDLGPRPPKNGPDINLRTELADAALAMDILTKLFLFIERDPEQLLAQDLFAMQDADRPAAVSLAPHMKSILNKVEKWIDRLDEQTRQWKPG